MKVGFEGREWGLDLVTLQSVPAKEVGFFLVEGKEEEFLSLLESELGRDKVSKLLHKLIERVVQDSEFVKAIHGISTGILAKKH